MKQFRDVFLFEEDERDFDHNGIGTLIDFVEEPEINRIINGRFSFLGKYAIDGQLAEKIQKGMMIKAYCPDGTWQPFRIGKPILTLETIEFEARHYCFDANRNFVIDMFVSAGNGPKLMQELKNNLAFEQQFKYESDLATVHQFTAKEGHPIDILIGSNNGNQNMTGVTSGELDMHDNVISLKNRLGEDRGFRVDFGINLESIKETIEDEEPPNTLYLVGATPEGTYDDPPPPITVKYLEAPGIKVTDKNRVIRKYSNEECKTEEALIEWANKILFDKRKVHLPKTMHEISIVDLAGTMEYEDYENLVQLNIGDTVTGILQSNRAEITERMIEYTWYPRLGEYKAITLGNDLGFYTSKTQDGIKGALVELNKTENSLYEKILNATELITGTSAGHIMQYPKNEPYELRIMDTDDEKTAKKVWRWNLGGLGYSKNGVNGPFELAMTQDGMIVADFIKAGVLNGVKIQAEDDNFLIELFEGKIRFLDSKSKKEIGALSPVFGEDGLTGYSFIQNPGFEFNLSSLGNNGTDIRHAIQIPKQSHADDIQVILQGKFHLNGELYINGQLITPGPNSGGGGGSGAYGDKITAVNLNSNVQALMPLFEKYAQKHGIPDYVGLGAALVMVENPSTNGQDDVMQSSESAGYPGPGYLTGEASIDQGFKHLANVINSARAKGVDIWGAMQSYNFGSAYVNWLAARGGTNTTDLAEEYSRTVVAPSLGNTTGATYSYVNAVSIADGRTYLYLNGGNFHYVGVLKQYVKVEQNKDIIVVAESQIGQQGGAPYWQWYGYGYRVEWCAIFVSWCANQIGVLDKAIPKFAWVDAGRDWFVARNQYHPRGSYTPQRGDVIFFDWGSGGSLDHVGLVESVSGGQVNTIEGNSGDQVARRSYSLSSSYIIGYGSPNY